MQMQGQQMWAPPPGVQAPANCPPGLEYLLHVDQLLVKQQVELLEAFTGFETANKYKVFIKNSKTIKYIVYTVPGALTLRFFRKLLKHSEILLNVTIFSLLA